jgi:hypothetical protein
MFRRFNFNRPVAQHAVPRRRSPRLTAKPFHRRLRIEPLEDRRLLATFTVTNLDDGFVSEFVSAPGTLRQAIFDANQTADADLIEFQAGLSGTIVLTEGELTISKSVQISGPGANLLTIDANGASRVFNVDDGTGTLLDVEMVGLTITGGATAFDGAGILNHENLQVFECVISNNSAGEDGGGIANFSGTFTVTHSTIHGNSADGASGGGAGIFNFSAAMGDTSQIINSTISNNTTTTTGGGVYNFLGTIIVVTSTITENTAPFSQGSGIATLGDTNVASTQLYSSIVSGNFSTDVDIVVGLTPSFDSGGWNLIGFGNSTGSFVADGDQTFVADPGLGPLADNGGPTPTHALLPGSPAIDAGNEDDVAGVTVEAFDQRRSPHVRIVDGDDDSVAIIDIGAFEKDTIEFFVDTLDDEDDSDFSPGDFSLREAIGQAELVGEALPVVQFVEGFFEGGPGTLFLTMGQLEVNGRMEIRGPGAELFTIDAQGNSRVFNVNNNDNGILVDVTISGLTMTGGSDGGGGGALFSQENLTIADCTVTGSTAEWGGGLYNGDVGNMTVLRSTVTGNTANASGGGLYNWISNVHVQDSTFSGNYAPHGAGFRNANGGYLRIDNSTVTGNIADNTGGGLSNDFATAKVYDSTFSDNDALKGGAISSRGASGELTIDHSTITGNTAAQEAGGIENYSSTAVIADSTISANSAPNGGGIGNFFGGDLTLLRSTVSGNMAVGGVDVFNAGGGALNRGGIVEINYSTFSGNAARYGGGFYNETTLENVTLVSNSTFSDNVANDAMGSAGAGIYNYTGHLIIEFSTITENHSNDFAGSGVVSWGDGLTTLTEIHSSIIAGNDHTDAASQGPPGNTFASLGFNLVGVFGFAETFTQPGDNVIGGDDPLLDDLQDNGGPTLTHALLEGSPAIDGGDPFAVAGLDGVPDFDQRGPSFVRVFDAYGLEDPRIDIGAFELNTVISPPAFLGDYNKNDIVDSADYVEWRNTLGSLVAKYHGADGDGNGYIERPDFDIWKANFGETPPEGAATAAVHPTSTSTAESVQIPAAVRSGPRSEAARPAFAASSARYVRAASDRAAPPSAEAPADDLTDTNPAATVRSLPLVVEGRAVSRRPGASSSRADVAQSSATRDLALLSLMADAELSTTVETFSAAEVATAPVDPSPDAVDAALQSSGLEIAWQRLQ